MPLYEYKCENTSCAKAEELQEHIAKVTNRDQKECETCKELLQRQISKGGGKHISWSLWQV